MVDDGLGATDAAIRQRITELCVHIPCGGVRGRISWRDFGAGRVWQSCRCEDHPERWHGADVSRQYDLCIICFRGTAGGRSRWSWLACADCRAVNDSIQRRTGIRPFALGRHSLMNGIGVRGGLPPEVAAEELARLAEFARGDGRLRDWRRREYPRLAAVFDPLADIPLREWQQCWPPGPAASADAFKRLVNHDDPLITLEGK